MEEEKKSIDLPIEEGDVDGVANKRESWDSKADFLLSCIGYAVGFGNLWRFPYLCYSNGGGAFLIPYLLFLFTCGIPLMAMELSLGQYFRKGPIKAFYNICPLLGGTGYGMLTSLFLVGVCYVVIFAWVLFFLIASFMNPLPWTTCDNSWNTPRCFVNNGTESNRTGTSPSQEFFQNRVLQATNHPSKFGSLNWELSLLLLAAWTIIYLCVFKGIKWSGKVVYFTATFPYLVLIVLFFRGVTLPGAGNGISYYLRIDVDKLKEARTWGNAGTQIFFSLGTVFGPLVTFASYNKKSNNVLRDATIISLVNCGTSFFSGFVVFSVLGYLANQQRLPISKVAAEGPGLVFTVYPAALATLPGSNFWSIIFFLMLVTLGIDSAMAAMEGLSTGVIDMWPKFRPYKAWITLVWVAMMFFVGLTCVTEGGFYILNLFNWYAVGLGLFLTAGFEIVAVSYFYGGNRFISNITQMTGRRVWLYWKVCWYLLTPAMILTVVLFSCINYYPIVFGPNIPYPWWGEFLGWLITVGVLCAIIIPGICLFFKTEGTIKERFLKLAFVPKTQRELEGCDGVEYAMDEGVAVKTPTPP